jgi:hypothetical protein
MNRSVRIACNVEPSDGARVTEWAGYLRIWGTLVVVLAVILGSPLQTWAHSDPASTLLSADASQADASQQECQAPQPRLPAAHPTSSAMRGAPLTVILFVFTAVAMAQGVWRWRRLTTLGLVLVLATFTFGSAVHAVHHLSEPEKAAECLVFSVSQHVSGTLDEPCDVHAPGLAVTTASPDNPNVPTFIPRCGSDLPRAPPSFLA